MSFSSLQKILLDNAILRPSGNFVISLIFFQSRSSYLNQRLFLQQKFAWSIILIDADSMGIISIKVLLWLTVGVGNLFRVCSKCTFRVEIRMWCSLLRNGPLILRLIIWRCTSRDLNQYILCWKQNPLCETQIKVYIHWLVRCFFFQAIYHFSKTFWIN